MLGHQLEPMARTEALRNNQRAACCQHAHINIQVACKCQASLTKNHRLVIYAKNAVLLRKKIRPAVIAAPQQLALACAAARHDAHAGRLRYRAHVELLRPADLRRNNRYSFCAAVRHKAHELACNAVLMDEHRRLAVSQRSAQLLRLLHQTRIGIGLAILHERQLLLRLLL